MPEFEQPEPAYIPVDYGAEIWLPSAEEVEVDLNDEGEVCHVSRSYSMRPLRRRGTGFFPERR